MSIGLAPHIYWFTDTIYFCDRCNENPTSSYNSVFKIITNEIHWIKTLILIAGFYSKEFNLANQHKRQIKFSRQF